MIACALDWNGPALAPVDPGLPATRLRRLIELLAPAAVTAADGVTGVTCAGRAAAHVARKLPAFAVPRDLAVVAEIPLLPAGKPDIPALRAKLWEQSRAGSVST